MVSIEFFHTLLSHKRRLFLWHKIFVGGYISINQSLGGFMKKKTIEIIIIVLAGILSVLGSIFPWRHR